MNLDQRIREIVEGVVFPQAEAYASDYMTQKGAKKYYESVAADVYEAVSALRQLMVEARIDEANEISLLIAAFDQDSEAFWGDGHTAVQDLINTRMNELTKELPKDQGEIRDGR